MLAKLRPGQWTKHLNLLVLICLVTNHVQIVQLETDDVDYDISDTYILQRPPYKLEPTYRNPYKPVSKHTQRKKKPQHFASTTESLCVRNLKKKKAEEERENPPKKIVISGNRWHGPVQYGEYMWKTKRQEKRTNRLRPISQIERKLHKCYKWVNSKELKQYEWPAIIQTIESKDLYHIEICCPDFGPIRYMGNTLCRPFCSNCRNGDCIAPDKCRCFDGFVLTDNEECVFTCPISCLNGRCNLLLNTCLCNNGFKLDETKQFCRPICHSGCDANPLHNCTAPEVCGCVRGYSLTDNGCQPIAKG
ncbi:uncharacterized protein LOC111682938 [Lucilia cuprina]|uniref:uncharacterized protein LOC111682938 n=1 Tax=Lucilia cuprina TaxID=7375 RepID=UPI001F058AD0|nr:uncharacterized protein LOC111682938 [Lucilia cuprina]